MTLALFALAQSVLSHTNCAYGKYSNYQPNNRDETDGAINVCGEEYVGDLGYGRGDQEGCGRCAAPGIGLKKCTGRNGGGNYVHFQDPVKHAEHLCFRDIDNFIIPNATEHQRLYGLNKIKYGCKNRTAICMPGTVNDSDVPKWIPYAFVCEPDYIWKGKAGMNPRVAEFDHSLLGCEVDDNGNNVLSHERGYCIETPTKDPLVATNENIESVDPSKSEYKAYDTVTVTCKGDKYFDPETFGSFVDKVEFVLALVGEETVDWRINHDDGKDTEITSDIIYAFCNTTKGCKIEGSTNFDARAALDGGGCIKCTPATAVDDCASMFTNTTEGICVGNGTKAHCKPKPISISAKNEMPFGLSSSVFFGLSVAALILCCLCLFCIGKRFIVGKDITSEEWNAQSSFGAGGSKSSHSRGGKSRRPAAE